MLSSTLNRPADSGCMFTPCAPLLDHGQCMACSQKIQNTFAKLVLIAAGLLGCLYQPGWAELGSVAGAGSLFRGGESMAACEEGLTEDELDSLRGMMPAVLENIRSLEEFERWLRSQRCVTSVETANYLVKTEPPAKEIIIAFKMRDGTTVTKIIDVIMQSNDRFRVGGFHDR